MPLVDPSPLKRLCANEDTLPAAKKARTTAESFNPLQIKPLGNLLWQPENRWTRELGLGNLAVLPDELLLTSIFSLLEGEDLVRMAGTSRALFAWSSVEGMWKGLYIAKTQGRLLEWRGSWRASYIATFLRPSSDPADAPLPSSSISTPTLHSDVLFQPCLCAAFDARDIFLSPSFSPSIPRLSGADLLPSDLPHEPVILTGLASSWPALSSDPSRRWTLADLSARFPAQNFRAEATLTTLKEYTAYHDRCAQDESPLYLFESEFVRKTEGHGEPSLGEDYEVPRCFSEDLFGVMGDERPDYRWLIAGPERSGSTFHKDPNSTSAWNTVVTGQKAWVMFPPEVTPPGVYASPDGAHVEAPLSLAEWFLSYYKTAQAIYGAKAKDPATRGKMREGICGVGETVYVPSGWWHIVINLAPSIAVTQNFVSARELPAVLDFMKHRPDQVSGFKLRRPSPPSASPSSAPTLGGLATQPQADEVHEEGGLDECDETGQGLVFPKFISALRLAGRGDLVDLALEDVEARERARDEARREREKRSGGWWSRVTERKEDEGEEEGGFSFGFGEGELELDEEFEM
ncbi:hypothetical protein JCM10207_006407 [Rhodosporidiobolus poonsookiae]